MGTHALPADEIARIDALSRYHILDSPPETAFDDLVHLAASLCRAPFAAITFIDRDRQWVKASVGLDMTHTERASGLCSYTIQSAGPLRIEDARADPRFSSHAWVTGGPQIRCYCGVPIVTADGYAVGTLAVMDAAPRKVADEHCLALQRLARQVTELLELRVLRSGGSSPSTIQQDNEEVWRLTAGSARSTGSEFLQELVETLAQLTGVEFGFCVRVLPGGARAQTVAGWSPNGLVTQFEYELAGTPCETVLINGFCHHPRAVQASFPQDDMLRQLSIESYMALALRSTTGVPIGWIALLGTQPLKDATRAESLLRMVAGRAGSELGRDLAEQQLKESEERYALALEGTSDGIWDWNPLTGELYLSRRWKELLGFADHELPNSEEAFFSRLHPDDAHSVGIAIREHLKHGTAYDVECRLLHQDGTYRWIHSRGKALRNEAGQTCRVVGAISDITERKRAESERAERETHLSLALDAAGEGTFDWNLASNRTTFSPRGLEIFGFAPDDAASFEDCIDRIHPEDRARIAHRFGESLKNHAEYEAEYRLALPGGVERWVLAKGRGLTNQQGQVVRAIGVILDITEQKRSEEALRASEERFRAAYHNATVGMSIADVNGRIQEVNQALCGILGYSEQELLTRTFQSLTHPDDLTQNLERIHKLLVGALSHDVFEKRYIRKDGGIVWAQVGVSVIRNEAGTPLYSLALVQDITERKRAEEALQLAKYTVDHATEAIYWVGAGAELLDVNDSACAMLGYSKEEFLRMRVHDINPYFQPDSWPTFWEETRKRGRASFESWHRAKDGRLIPIELNVNFIRYGGVECHFAFVRDITERKRAGDALRASEERFHFAIEATNDGLWDWDIQTDVVYYSPRWIRLLGYLPEEVAPTTAFFFGVLHPEDVDRTKEVLQAHLDGRTPVKEVEVRLRQKSGEYRWYLDRGKVVERAPDGRPLRMVGTITDITERKQADRERAEALSNLQTIMETVPDVIFALDLDGRLCKWNLRLETVTGYTRSELQGKPALEMVPPEEAGKTAAAIREAFDAGYAELEGHLLTKDGRAVLYHWTGAPYTDLQGRVIGVTGVGRDIVERKKVEQMLAAEKRVLELMGSDAPLAAVLAEICLMIEGLSNGVFCSVLLLDEGGASLRHGAGPSLPETFIRGIDGIAIGPSRGSCGTAAFTGQQVIVTDIASHPFWDDFRDLALAHGLRACWSNPIISAAGKVLGTFAVYYETPRQPADELLIVSRASHLACLAIERKRTESALRLTRFSIQQAVDAVLWIDAEARLLDVNDAACTILGYTRDELLSMTLHDIDSNFPLETWTAHWEDLRVRKSFSFESQHRKKDGTVIQTETTMNFLIHEGREYNCAFMRDITDRKRAEAQVHLTQFAIERAADMVFWVDEQARILLVNEAACQRMGYSREELLGMAVPDFDSNYQMEGWARHWQDLRATGRQRLETQHRAKSGELYPVEVVANYVVFEGREYNFATVRDISARKRTEALLRSSEERFRLVAQATNDILWDWDLLTNEHWWSPNACEKFGYDPRREPSVDAWTGRLHHEDKVHILSVVKHAIESDVRTFAAEYRFQLADGTYGYFLDRAHIVRDESGAAIRMIGAMIDVTGSKRAYASLEEAYRRFQAMSQELQMVESNERRRLSRELHDEVGQLLTSLKFDLASVKRSVAGRSKAVGSRGQERLARALDTTDLLFTRLRQIVRALRPPVLEELGLKAGLEALIADVQARTGLHCSMVFEQEERCAARLPTLETAFYRIVQELLTNVIRHARATSVSIAMNSGLREWQLTVKDDGIGFDVAGLSPTGGFGLRGIRERVEILAGQVEIVSGPETGTSVHVSIPVSREPEGSQGSVTQAASPRRRRRKVVHE